MNVLHEEGNKMMQEFVSKFDSSSTVTEICGITSSLN